MCVPCWRVVCEQMALLREISNVDFNAPFGWSGSGSHVRGGNLGIAVEWGGAHHAPSSGVGMMKALLRTVWEGQGAPREHAFMLLETIIVCCKVRHAAGGEDASGVEVRPRRPAADGRRRTEVFFLFRDLQRKWLVAC